MTGSDTATARLVTRHGHSRTRRSFGGILAAFLLVALVPAIGLPLTTATAQEGEGGIGNEGFLPPPANSPLPLPTAPDRSPPPAGVTLTTPDETSPAEPAANGAVFRIGFLAGTAPAHRRALLEPFTDHAQAVLGRPVDLVPFREARGLIDAMERGTIRYGMGPASLVAALSARCACVEPLASQLNRDGGFGLFSALLAPRDGAVRGAADLADDARRIILVGQGSVVAHHLGLSELWRSSVSLQAEQLVFAASLSEAYRQLVAGEGDAILTWTRQVEGGVLFDAPPAHDLTDEERAGLRIVWRSRALVGHSHFIHTGVSEEERSALRAMLTGLHGRDGDAFDALDRGSGRAFRAVMLEDYQPYRDALTYWQTSGATP